MSRSSTSKMFSFPSASARVFLRLPLNGLASGCRIERPNKNTEATMETDVARMIAACGGFSHTVKALMSFSRAFWQLCSDGKQDQESKNSLYRRNIPTATL